MKDLRTIRYSELLEGGHLPSNDLQEIIQSEKMVILHFLRHLGCLFCQHNVDQLYHLSQELPNFPTIYFVHQSSVEAGEAFFAKHFPNAPHISDPQMQLYQLFGIRKLAGIHLLNPKMIFKGILLTLKGYFNRYKEGNIMMLSGTFLFHNGKLVWEHRAKYAGDSPRLDRLLKK